MNTESISMVTEYLDKLGAKLGVGVEHVWPWLVRQQYIDAITAWFFFAVISTVMFFYVRYMLAHWDPRDKDGNRRKDVFNICYEDFEPFAFVGGIGLAILLVVAATTSFCTVTQVLNPEYYALKSLMSMVKP